MASISTRRSMFAAAGAVALGSGFTVGVTGSFGDVAEPPQNSDGVLIALCREYVEHSTRHAALCALQDAMPERHSAAEAAEWDRLDDLVGELGLRMGQLEDEIPDLPALTLAGQRAKAEALLHLMRHISPKHGSTFARSLALDLVGRA